MVVSGSASGGGGGGGGCARRRGSVDMIAMCVNECRKELFAGVEGVLEECVIFD